MRESRAKKLVRYVVPTVLSNLSICLFTVVDGIFVGRGVGTVALGAVNLALPFVLVVLALDMLATIGGVTVTAIRLGRGDKEGANQAFMSSLVGIVAISIVLFIAGVCFAGPLARLLGANDTYFEMVTDYLFWYGIFIIPSGFGMLLQGFCRNDGAPALVGAAVISGTVLNIFGDWLFVFPLQMGVKGAAIATGISQTVAMLIVLTHFIRKKGDLRIAKFKPNAALFRKVAVRGLPEMIAQFATPVTTLCLNYVLIRRLGDTAVNAFSIINYVNALSAGIFFGASEGLQPLFGQSYGAKNADDLKYYFHTGLLISFIGSLIIFILILFAGGPVCALFGADHAAYDVTVSALPKFSWSFIFVSVNTIISAYLYSTKRTAEAVILNAGRGLLLNSVIISALPIVFGSGVIWFTAGIAEVLSFALAIALLKKSERYGIVFK